MANLMTSVVGATAWAALVLQYALIIANNRDGLGPALATLRYLSFFTILSNLLVALVCSFVLVPRPGRAGELFAGPRVRAAAALYIAVTGLVYVTVLQGLWAPTGAQLVADVLLHDVVPLAYVGTWLAFAPHGLLVWSDALRFLLFPLAYVAWTVARGAVLREYPYPFIDVTALGYVVALRNAAALALFFLVLGLVVVGVDRLLARGRRPSRA